ncbi:MAG: hypothetical protein ACREBR_03145 [bacterium]
MPPAIGILDGKTNPVGVDANGVVELGTGDGTLDSKGGVACPADILFVFVVLRPALPVWLRLLSSSFSGFEAGSPNMDALTFLLYLLKTQCTPTRLPAVCLIPYLLGYFYLCNVFDVANFDDSPGLGGNLGGRIPQLLNKTKRKHHIAF